MGALFMRLLILMLVLTLPVSGDQEVSAAAVADGAVAMRLNMLRLQRMEVIRTLGSEAAYHSPQAIEAALQAKVITDERLVRLKGLNEEIQGLRTQNLKSSLPRIEDSSRFQNRWNENQSRIRDYKRLYQQATQANASEESLNALKKVQKRLYLERSELTLRHQLIEDGTFKSPQELNKAISSSHSDSRVKALDKVLKAQGELQISRSESARVGALHRTVRTARTATPVEAPQASQTSLKTVPDAPKARPELPRIEDSSRFQNRWKQNQTRIQEYDSLYKKAQSNGASKESLGLLNKMQQKLGFEQTELKLRHQLIEDGTFKSPQELNKAVSSNHSDSRVKALDKAIRSQADLKISRTETGQLSQIQQTANAPKTTPSRAAIIDTPEPLPQRAPSSLNQSSRSYAAAKAQPTQSGGFGKTPPVAPRAATASQGVVDTVAPRTVAAPAATSAGNSAPKPVSPAAGSTAKAPAAASGPKPVSPAATSTPKPAATPSSTARPASVKSPTVPAGPNNPAGMINDALGSQINPIANEIKDGIKTSNWQEYLNSIKETGTKVTDKVLKGPDDPKTGRTGYEVKRDSIVESLKGKITSLNDEIAAATQAGDADKASKLKSLKDSLDTEVRKAQLGVQGAQLQTEITAIKDHIKVLKQSGGDKQLVKTLQDQLKVKESEFGKITADSKANAKSYVKDGLHFAVISAATQGILNLVDQVRQGEDINLGNAFEFVTTPDFILGTAGAYAGGLLVQKGLATGMGKIAMASLQNMVPGPLKFVVQALPYTIGAMLGSDVASGNFGRHSVTDMVFNGVGGSVGMMLGSAFFPPIGSIIGSVLGSLAGDAIAKMIQGKDEQEIAAELLYEPAWNEIKKPAWKEQDQTDMAIALHGSGAASPSLNSLRSDARNAETLSDLEKAKDEAYTAWQSISTNQGADTESARSAYELYQDLSRRIEEEKVGTVRGFGGF